jgi:tRNA-splicing ligase RtcB
MLPTERSAVVPQPYQYHRLVFPKVSKADHLARGIRKSNIVERIRRHDRSLRLKVMKSLKSGEIEIAVFGEHEPNTLEQIRNVASNEKVLGAALMADGHLGYGMPIGGVVAYDDAVSPEGVGFDIGCGNMAVRTALTFEDIEVDLSAIMDRVFEGIAFGVGQASGLYGDHEVFDRPEWSLFKSLKPLARDQLGSVGSGNHYVDLLVDDDGALWVGVHFGSRGLGHKIASGYMSDGDMMKPVTVIDLSSPRGSDYWAGMELAGAYAYAGRDCVVRQVLDILGTTTDLEIHNHHNYAWREDVPGIGQSVVVRKGATPAYPGQQGFVGGSMGDDAVILRGVEASDSEKTLASTVHGAGRVMSRSQARGKWRKGKQVHPGKVSHEAMRGWIADRGVELRGADLDEAPQAYRRLSDVLVAQGDSIDVTFTLRPVGVAMAGKRDFDPYKD